MSCFRYLPLLGTALFCLTSMAGCPNKEPGGQLTVVKGKVVNLRTGRPLPGVLVALVSDDRGTSSYNQLEDSVRTGAQGGYAFSFRNVEGLYYAVSCEGTGIIYPYLPPYRLDFADSAYTTPGFKGTTTKSLRTVDLVLGRQNAVLFRTSPRPVFRVQLATRTTGYQHLYFAGAQPLPADNQHQIIYLYQSVPFTSDYPQDFYRIPSTVPRATFSRTLPGTMTQDTTVLVKISSPLTGDTVQASLSFGR